MTMTDEEIRRSYRLAKHPKRHIAELAQLNACHRDKIQEIVKDVVPVVGIKDWPHPTRGKTKAEIEALYLQRSTAFLEKYLEGLNDCAIARVCGVPYHAVWRWRTREELPSNYRRRKGD